MRSRSLIPRQPNPHAHQASDRRRSMRTLVSHAARLLHRGQWTPITVIDLSRHGLRICGSGSFKAGDDVVLELASPCALVQLPAHVVWNDHGRKRLAGLSLLDLAKHEALALHATLFEARRRLATFERDVLLVADDPAAQLAIADGIVEQRCEVAARLTREGALAYLGAHAPRARAAFVSAGLPDRSGQAILDAIAEHHPTVRRVMLVDNLMA